jgi:hypothetical protein
VSGIHQFGLDVNRPASGLSVTGKVGLLDRQLQYQTQGKALDARRAAIENLDRQIEELQQEFDHLVYIGYELDHVPSFLRSIGVEFGGFASLKDLPNDPPPFVPNPEPGKVFSGPLGHYRLNLQFWVHEKSHRALDHTLKHAA